MQNFDEKSANMHMGRLIQMLSHQMKRKNCIVTMIDGDSLTVMQKHILKFILLETLHREIYQKDIEEEFQWEISFVSWRVAWRLQHVREQKVTVAARVLISAWLN